MLPASMPTTNRRGDHGARTSTPTGGAGAIDGRQGVVPAVDLGPAARRRDDPPAELIDRLDGVGEPARPVLGGQHRVVDDEPVARRPVPEVEAGAQRGAGHAVELVHRRVEHHPAAPACEREASVGQAHGPGPQPERHGQDDEVDGTLERRGVGSHGTVVQRAVGSPRGARVWTYGSVGRSGATGG